MALASAATAPAFTPEEVAAGLSYAAYRQRIEQLLAEGKTTGPTQSDELLAYAQLNQQRMVRLDKTVQVLPALQAAVWALRYRYQWVVITEGWCGDAAQVVPVLEAVARAADGRLDTRYLLRDEHLPVIDRYLTQHLVPKVSAHLPVIEKITVTPREPRVNESFWIELKPSAKFDPKHLMMKMESSANAYVDRREQKGLSWRIGVKHSGEVEIPFWVADKKTLLSTRVVVKVKVLPEKTTLTPP